MKDFYQQEIENTKEKIKELLFSQAVESYSFIKVEAPFSCVALFNGKDTLLYSSPNLIVNFNSQATPPLIDILIVDANSSREDVFHKISEAFASHSRGLQAIFSYLDDAFDSMRRRGKISVSYLEKKFSARGHSSHLFFLLPYVEEMVAGGVEIDFSLVADNKYDYGALRVGSGLKFIPLAQYRLEMAKKFRMRRMSEIENHLAKEWLVKRIKQVKTLAEFNNYFGHEISSDLVSFFNSKDFKNIEHQSMKISSSDMLTKVLKWRKSKIKVLKSLETEKDKKLLWSAGNFHVYDLLSPVAWECEGLVMRNCLKSQIFDLKKTKIFSLRDSEGKSLACVEWDIQEEVVGQIKGFSNEDVGRELKSPLANFFREVLNIHTSSQLASGLSQQIGLKSITPFPLDLKFQLLVPQDLDLETTGLMAPWGWNEEMLESYFKSINLSLDFASRIKTALNANYRFKDLYVDFDLRKLLVRVSGAVEGLMVEGFNLEGWLRANQFNLKLSELKKALNFYLGQQSWHQDLMLQLEAEEQEKYLVYLNKLHSLIGYSCFEDNKLVLDELKKLQKE